LGHRDQSREAHRHDERQEIDRSLGKVKILKILIEWWWWMKVEGDGIGKHLLLFFYNF